MPLNIQRSTLVPGGWDCTRGQAPGRENHWHQLTYCPMDVVLFLFHSCIGSIWMYWVFCVGILQVTLGSTKKTGSCTLLNVFWSFDMLFMVSQIIITAAQLTSVSSACFSGGVWIDRDVLMTQCIICLLSFWQAPWRHDFLKKELICKASLSLLWYTATRQCQVAWVSWGSRMPEAWHQVLSVAARPYQGAEMGWSKTLLELPVPWLRWDYISCQPLIPSLLWKCKSAPKLRSFSRRKSMKCGYLLMTLKLVSASFPMIPLSGARRPHCSFTYGYPCPPPHAEDHNPSCPPTHTHRNLPVDSPAVKGDISPPWTLNCVTQWFTGWLIFGNWFCLMSLLLLEKCR